jgi:hypothetical protein
MLVVKASAFFYALKRALRTFAGSEGFSPYLRAKARTTNQAEDHLGAKPECLGSGFVAVTQAAVV